MSSPFMKIGELVVKQLSKPLANRVKAFAMENDTFKNICVGFAQKWHRFQTSMTIRVAGHTPAAIKPLDEVYIFASSLIH